MPSILLFFFFTNTDWVVEEYCQHLYYTSKQERVCLRVSLVYFYFLIMTAAFPVKIYANSKFIFASGGDFLL